MTVARIKRTTSSESQEQKALFQWAGLAEQKYPELKLLHHIPNGGIRDIRTAANLKKEGVKRGVPDIEATEKLKLLSKYQNFRKISEVKYV